MRVEKLFKRLKREFLKVNVLQAALDSILFFLTANLLLFLFSLTITGGDRNLEYLIPLSLMIFAADLFYRSRNYNIEIYEEKNPELRERLRTARDNVEENNIVSQALFDEVLDRSRSVTSESIIPSKRIIQKMLAIGLISFITVLSGIFNVQVIQEDGQIIPDTENLLDKIDRDKEEFQLQNDSDIYGDKDEISVSDSLIEYNITGSGAAEDSLTESRNREPENPVMTGSYSGLRQNLELAKRYNLEIRDFNQ